jgi:hypothetical protein
VPGGGQRLVSSWWVLGARRVHTRPVDIGCGGRGEGPGGGEVGGPRWRWRRHRWTARRQQVGRAMSDVGLRLPGRW